MKIFIYILSELLHRANSGTGVNTCYNRKFYEVKNMLLKKYGNRDGYDLQYFSEKYCFQCDGMGWDDQCNRPCWRCNSTGIYLKEKYVILLRYKLGKYGFHLPKEVTQEQIANYKLEHGEEKNWIGGRIRHYREKRSLLTLMILFLIYKPSECLRMIILEYTSYRNNIAARYRAKFDKWLHPEKYKNCPF